MRTPEEIKSEMENGRRERLSEVRFSLAARENNNVHRAHSRAAADRTDANDNALVRVSDWQSILDLFE